MLRNRFAVLWVSTILVGLGVSIPLDGVAATPVRKAPAKTAVVHKSVPAKKPPVRPVTGTAPKPIAKPAAVAVNPNAFILAFNEGKQAYEAGKYAQAQAALRKSMVLAEKSHTPQHRNIAIIANLLGLAEWKMKNYPAATTAMKRAISIYSLPENQSEHQLLLASEYMTLGEIAMTQGNFAEAKAVYTKAKPIAEGLNDQPRISQINQVLSDIARIDEGPDYLDQMGSEVSRWSQPNQPILVYISEGDYYSDWKPANRFLVQQAFAEWQAAMGPRLQFQFVDTPAEADIRVSWMDRPSEDAELLQATGHKELRNGLCRTHTLNNYFYRDDIELALHNTDGSPFSENGIYNTSLHEIAHAIGLFHGHSTNPKDVLFASNRYEDGLRKHLTERDIATAHRLYELKPNVTNPPGIHLVKYSEFANLRLEGSHAFNAKNYPGALASFQKALSIYGNDGETLFWAGMSAWYLNQYEVAIPYLMVAGSQPIEHQADAIRMAGISLLMSGQKDDKAGAHSLAEDKYRRAYQVLSQAQGRVALTAEKAKAVQDTMSWLNQRLAMRSVVQWAGNNPQGQMADASSGEPMGKKKKKHWWSFEPPSGYTNRVPVQIMIPGHMMGY